MEGAELLSWNSVGLVAGFAVTLAVLSYLLGDNPAYRFAVHLFLGATVGYALGVVSWEVFVLRIGVALFVDREYVILAPVCLGLLLLVKAWPRIAHVGNVSMAFLIGAGAAVTVSGAIVGTLVPQVGATARAASPDVWPSLPLGWVDGVMVVVGTVCTLVAFRYIGRRPRGRLAARAWPGRAVGFLGRWFLVIALAVAFGGALTAALSVFVGRIDYLIGFFRGLF
jgi:hypothetical protein